MTMVEKPLRVKDSFMERHVAIFYVWAVFNRIKFMRQLDRTAAPARVSFDVAAGDLRAAWA